MVVILFFLEKIIEIFSAEKRRLKLEFIWLSYALIKIDNNEKKNIKIKRNIKYGNEIK